MDPASIRMKDSHFCLNKCHAYTNSHRMRSPADHTVPSTLVYTNKSHILYEIILFLFLKNNKKSSQFMLLPSESTK